MKKTLFTAIIALIFGSCTNKPAVILPSHTEIEHKVYAIPAKKQVSVRVFLNETATIDQLKALTDSLYYAATYEKTELGNPTHVFVYVYAKQGDYETDATSWIAMRSMENKQESEITLKTTTK